LEIESGISKNMVILQDFISPSPPSPLPRLPSCNLFHNKLRINQFPLQNINRNRIAKIAEAAMCHFSLPNMSGTFAVLFLFCIKSVEIHGLINELRMPYGQEYSHLFRNN
jgi:hypothetical protein